jgi:hypothetical protein
MRDGIGLCVSVLGVGLTLVGVVAPATTAMVGWELVRWMVLAYPFLAAALGE